MDRELQLISFILQPLQEISMAIHSSLTEKITVFE